MDWATTIGEVLDEFGKGARYYGQFMAFQALVKLDRDTALAQLQRKVQVMTPQEFDLYEREFLQSSNGLIDFDHRIRAMELYAAMKMMELNQYRQFRGFGTTGGALQ